MISIQYIGITWARTPTRKYNKIKFVWFSLSAEEGLNKNIEIKSNEQKIIPSSLQKKKQIKKIRNSFVVLIVCLFLFQRKKKEYLFFCYRLKFKKCFDNFLFLRKKKEIWNSKIIWFVIYTVKIVYDIVKTHLVKKKYTKNIKN